MVLYDYQSKLLSDLRNSIAKGFRRICCVSPTGSGKTVMIREFVRSLQAKYSTCFLLPSKVLLDQSVKAYKEVGINFGRLHGCGQFNDSIANWLSTVQTLVARVEKNGLAIDFQFFIVDECHHVRSSTYTRLMAELFPEAYFIGFTATPVRTDGRGLGAVVDGFRSFQDIVFGPSVNELIAANRLSDYTVFRPPNAQLDPIIQKALRQHDFHSVEDAIDSGAIIGDMISLFKRHAGGERGLAFARNIVESKFFTHKYREAGIKTAHLDGSMTTSERRSIIKDYAENRLQVLTSCNTISEGFDVPSCKVVQLGRFTESLSLYCQQKGRGIRYQEGKKAVILDHANNFALHGDMRWYTEEDWRAMFLGETIQKEIKVHECSNCFAALSFGVHICPECGHNNGSSGSGAKSKKTEIDFSEINPVMVDVDLEEASKERLSRKMNPEEAFNLLANDFMRCNSLAQVKSVLEANGLQVRLAKLFYDKILEKKLEDIRF